MMMNRALSVRSKDKPAGATAKSGGTAEKLKHRFNISRSVLLFHYNARTGPVLIIETPVCAALSNPT